jgi:hypothetical protein
LLRLAYCCGSRIAAARVLLRNARAIELFVRRS